MAAMLPAVAETQSSSVVHSFITAFVFEVNWVFGWNRWIIDKETSDLRCVFKNLSLTVRQVFKFTVVNKEFSLYPYLLYFGGGGGEETKNG